MMVRPLPGPGNSPGRRTGCHVDETPGSPGIADGVSLTAPGLIPARTARRAVIVCRSSPKLSRCEWGVEAMVDDQGEIPLVGRLETPGADVQLVMNRPPDATIGRRLEDWIASNLDLPSEVKAPNRWEQIVGNLPGLRRPHGKPGERASQGRQVRSIGAWSRFQVAYRRGITVVRLVDQDLVQRSHIRELGDDLMDLIDVGNHRIVLNFSAVARLGSWIVGVVGNAHRRCAGVDGGKLKICGLDPHLADIFTIVGMTGQVELHKDE